MLSNEELRDVIADCKIKIRYKDVDILRELAKRAEVKMMYSISKSTGNPVFPGPVSEWNKLQQRLVYWLAFYSGLDSSYERPPDRVIKNNALLDRWCEEKAKEADQRNEQSWAKGSSSIQKTAYDHDEVYEL